MDCPCPSDEMQAAFYFLLFVLPIITFALGSIWRPKNA
jgi:hypothetical protein